MKWFVVLLAVLAGVWWWRRGQGLAQAVMKKPAAAPQAMRACRHCGVHVPEAEAVTGRLGAYCSAAHRQQAEGGPT